MRNAIIGYSDREGIMIGTGREFHALFLFVWMILYQHTGKKVDKFIQYNKILKKVGHRPTLQEYEYV